MPVRAPVNFPRTHSPTTLHPSTDIPCAFPPFLPCDNNPTCGNQHSPCISAISAQYPPFTQFLKLFAKSTHLPRVFTPASPRPLRHLLAGSLRFQQLISRPSGFLQGTSPELLDRVTSQVGLPQ